MGDYDYAELFREIESAVKSDASVRDGFDAVVSYCSQVRPHPDWEALRKVDIAGDAPRLKNWLKDVLDSEAPPTGTTGLWFGLFNAGYEDGSTSADMYVSGGAYDNDDPDWCVDPPWWPDGRYAQSEVHAQIYETAYSSKTGLKNAAEYPLCLTYGALAVRDLAQENTALVLGSDASRVLVVGFDGGDFLCLGRLTADGLTFSKESERMA